MLDAADGDDVASTRLLHLDALEAEEAEYLTDLLPAGVPGLVDHDHLIVAMDDAAADAPDADGPDVARVVEHADLELEGRIRIDRRGRAMLDDGAEEDAHVALHGVGRGTRGTEESRRVHDGEIELRLAGAEPVEEIEGLIEHPVRSRPIAIYLVD